MPVRVVLAESRALFAAGIRRFFDDADIELHSVTVSLRDLESRLFEGVPHVIVADGHVGGTDLMGKPSWLREQFPSVAVLIYSASANPVHEAAAFQAGAAGYLDWGKSREDFLAAVRQVAQGQTLWSVGDQRRLGNYKCDGEQPIGETAPLTRRELQVLKFLTTGATNKEISEVLAISHETVKEHVQHVLEKLGVNDRTQAAVWAVRHGVV